TVLHFGRQPPLVEVTRHGFDPGVRNPDDWSSQVLIGEADAFEHRPCRRPVAPVCDQVTPVLRIKCHNALLASESVNNIFPCSILRLGRRTQDRGREARPTAEKRKAERTKLLGSFTVLTCRAGVPLILAISS